MPDKEINEEYNGQPLHLILVHELPSQKNEWYNFDSESIAIIFHTGGLYKTIWSSDQMVSLFFERVKKDLLYSFSENSSISFRKDRHITNIENILVRLGYGYTIRSLNYDDNRSNIYLEESLPYNETIKSANEIISWLKGNNICFNIEDYSSGIIYFDVGDFLEIIGTGEILLSATREGVYSHVIDRTPSAFNGKFISESVNNRTWPAIQGDIIKLNNQTKMMKVLDK